jgi:hypothetical protein
MICGNCKGEASRIKGYTDESGEYREYCNLCSALSSTGGYPEFIPNYIKEGRMKHRKDIVQPFRNGEISREFVDSHPEKAQQMFTPQEIKTAKPVWRDLPEWRSG